MALIRQKVDARITVLRMRSRSELVVTHVYQIADANVASLGYPPSMAKDTPRTPSANRVRIDFGFVAAMSESQRQRIEAEALRANSRYLTEFVENRRYCPFAKEGREQGKTVRYVHLFGESTVASIVQQMTEVAANQDIDVAQLIFPLLEVEPKAWANFCHDVSARGHASIGGPPTLAVAPLHPHLSYREDNPFTLLTLFRRSPDPTIQWVRLRTLDKIYEGKRPGKVVMTTQEIAHLLQNPTSVAPPPTNLYDRIAETNFATAQRLGVAKVEAMARDISEEAEAHYATILATR